MKYRVATIKDIPVLSTLLNDLFSQEVEFVPNNKKQSKALKNII